MSESIDPPWDSIKTKCWYGDRVKFSNGIVLKRFNRKINERLMICKSFIRDYYRTHQRLDIAYDAIGKLDDLSLLLLCKYVCDVDRGIAFSCTERLKFFNKYISSVTSNIYFDVKSELASEIAMGLTFLLVGISVVFIYGCINYTSS